MAIECKAWRATSDNSLHNSGKDAAAHDLKQLRLKLAKSMSKEDELDDRLIKHSKEIIDVLTEYRKYHPDAPKESKGMTSEDEKRGPTKRDPGEPRTLAEIRADNGKDTRSPMQRMSDRLDKFAGHASGCRARAEDDFDACSCDPVSLKARPPVATYVDDLATGTAL